MEGLEPAHLSALDPKSSVSTNFTTSAFISTVEKALFTLNIFKEINPQKYEINVCPKYLRNLVNTSEHFNPTTPPLTLFKIA